MSNVVQSPLVSARQVGDTAARDLPSRKIGFGAPLNLPDKGGDGYEAAAKSFFIGALKKLENTPTHCLDVLETIRIAGKGPLSAADVDAIFGPQMDFTKALPSSVEVTTTMAEPGEFQITTMIYATQLRFEPEPGIGTALGLSEAVAEAAKPAAFADFADSYNNSIAAAATTGSDLITAGALGLAVGGAGTVQRAFLDYGDWTDLFFYYLSQAYRSIWQMGAKFFFEREELPSMAYTPTAAQNGSAGQTQREVYSIARDMNAYYQSATIGATRRFVVPDRERSGHALIAAAPGAAAPGALESVGRPTRSYETMDVMVGGVRLRGLLHKNNEFKRHANPRMIPGGVAIGLKYEEMSATLRAEAKKWMDVNHGLGGAGVPSFAEDSAFDGGITAAGTAHATGVELSSDAVVTQDSVDKAANRALYKAGRWSIVQAYRGKEMTEELVCILRDHKAVRDYVAHQLGVVMGPGSMYVR